VDFAVQLRGDGLREALATLLRKTDYRFIGFWRFQDGKAGAVVHHDRDRPEVLTATEVADTATYCCVVREAGAPFKTANAMVDERLATHPARAAVLPSFGVPVMDPAGAILDTLCHYDLVPRDPEQIDIGSMRRIGSYLGLGGDVPPWPKG
jgi:hypothetical protein